VVVTEDDEDIARLLAETLHADLDVDVTVVSNGALVPTPSRISGHGCSSWTSTCPARAVSTCTISSATIRRSLDVPVLFVTANPELAAGAPPSGAPREVMAKPFDITSLVERALLSEGVGVKHAEVITG
jgi:hypothetical protein